MAKRPTSLPAGLERFVITNAHQNRQIMGGILNIEGPMGNTRSLPIPGPIPFGDCQRILVAPGDQIDVERLECRLDLDDGTNVVFRDDLNAVPYRVRYAVFTIHDNAGPSDEVEMVGSLVLDQPAPLAIRRCIQWGDMEIPGDWPI